MKKLYRVILSLLLALVLLFTISIPVWAIAPPTAPTPNIDAINVYRSCVETNDQLYVIEYTITYGINPDEVVSEAYIFRLMNGGVELKATTAYAYQDDGYGRGIASIYFSAAEVTALGMGWIGAYTVVCSGNPTLTWTLTGCPYVTSTTYDSWNDPMGTLLGTYVMTLAQELTTSWGWAATPLFTSSGGTTTLSALGEDYFSTSIPNLMTMQPTIFSSSSQAAAYYERTNPLTYAASIDETWWVGTWVDDMIQPTAAAWAIDASFIYSGIWVIITMTLLGMIVYKVGLKFEILLLIGEIMMILGTLLHFVPMIIPIMIGVVLVLAFIWNIFWKPSNA